MDATYDYNKLISSRILDSWDKMLGIAEPGVGLPQPTMFGGKRMRNFVLPGSTDFDYPGTLSVGTMDGRPPATLAGAFWDDFSDGFPTGLGPVSEGVSGGVRAPEPRPRYTTMPVRPRLDKRRYAVPAVMPEGGSKKSNRAFVKGLKSFGKAVAPIAKEVGMMLLKEGVKEGVKRYSKAPASAPAPTGKGRCGGVSGGKMPRGIKGVAKRGAKAVKNLGVDIDQKISALRDRVEGGVLIRDDPSQFPPTSVYPPALASYTAGRDAYGRGRAKLPKSGAKRNSARGAIVAEVMKKQGLSLAQASKYVKEHGLY